MHLNRSLQYAFLLVLYLCRAGRARLTDVATSLKLSLSLLRVVSRKLRVGRVLNSIKGPGGGYEINGDPLVRDVLGALNITLFLTGRESSIYARGQAEHRALANSVHWMQLSLAAIMRKKVRSLNTELAMSELAALDRGTNFMQVN